MAANTTISNAAAIAACDSIVDLIDGGAGAGYVHIYPGSQPANPDVAAGETELVEITLSDPAFGGAADGTPGGVATADITPALTDTASATGTAAWFRAFDSNDLAIIDGSVATSDADMVIDSTSITSGQTVTITAWTITMPES